jgi:NAD+ kinase
VIGLTAFGRSVSENRVMGLIRAVGIVLHPKRNCGPVIDVVTKWAADTGVAVLGLPGENPMSAGRIEEVDPAELPHRTDLIVSLGGDGTMLRAMRLSAPTQTPVLGVNLGKLGFLAEVDVPELNEALLAINAERFTTEPRSGLGATIDGKPIIAFNDIAIERVPGRGRTDVQLHVEGNPFVRYSADAVVIATPTGSTAYAFSAGGPIVSPNADGLLVIPVAPHSAFNRAVFLSPGERLEVEVLPSSGEPAVEADGRVIGSLHPGDRVEMAVLSGAARVVRLGKTTFYQRAQRRLRLVNPLEIEEQ